MKLGATDYLPKPFEVTELDLVLRRALERPGRRAPDVAPPRAAGPRAEADAAAGRRPSPARWSGSGRSSTGSPTRTCRCCSSARAASARTSSPAASTRRAAAPARPFVKINCAALPGELLESELFGHEKGAFTGAHAEKPGKFELADQGTIFLDEIGEMDPRLQAKLLQVLQDEEFYRVGGKRSVRVDARVVVATNRNLEAAIRQGTFREDLFYRLNVVTIRVPPLRERKEDIGPLVQHFVEKYRRPLPRRARAGPARGDGALPRPTTGRATCASSRTSSGASSCCAIRRWCSASSGRPVARRRRPTNAAANSVRPARGRRSTRPLPEDAPLKDVARRAARIAEREAILRALMRTGWNKRKAAKRLQISYKALLYKIKDCEIVDPRDAAMIE